MLSSKLAAEDTPLTDPELALMQQWLTTLADTPRPQLACRRAGGHKQERTAPGDPGAGQGAHGRDRPLRGATVETRTSPHGMSTRPDIEGSGATVMDRKLEVVGLLRRLDHS